MAVKFGIVAPGLPSLPPVHKAEVERLRAFVPGFFQQLAQKHVGDAPMRAIGVALPTEPHLQELGAVLDTIKARKAMLPGRARGLASLPSFSAIAEVRFPRPDWVHLRLSLPSMVATLEGLVGSPQFTMNTVCVQSVLPPSNTIGGPYDTQEDCQAACGVTVIDCSCILTPALAASITNLANCACMDGVDVSMTSPDGSTASGATATGLCGAGQRQLSLSLYCVDETWLIDWSVTDAENPGCTGSGTEARLTTPPYAGFCDPETPDFLMYFQIDDYPADCCNGASLGSLRITIAPD